MMKFFSRFNAGNPFERGNALKNKNFDKFVFGYMALAVILASLLTLLALWLLSRPHHLLSAMM